MLIYVKCHFVLFVQSVLVRNLPSMLVHFTQVMPVPDLCQITVNLIASIPKNPHPDLNRDKLWCLKQLARSSLCATHGDWPC
jgi:hypothetical protein